jgi:sugar O-acyltransferase (sialic acid O-acetyltransferase NeuD family)
MKESILLIGGGGHCHACIDVIEQSGKYEIVGILDVKENIGRKVLGYTILGSDDDLPKFSSSVKNVLITIGQIKNFSIRLEKFTVAKSLGFHLPVIISPRAYVSPHAHVEEGTIIMHDALAVSTARIGKNCIINNKALIEHDSIIGDFCHVSTSAVVNGGCQVGEKSFIGSNSVLKEGISVPAESIIPAGLFYKGSQK